MIYEYRVYEPMPGKMEALQARFRNHTIRVFNRLNMNSVGYWTLHDKAGGDRLVYILAFEDARQREGAWVKMNADPEWQAIVKNSEVNGKLVKSVTSTLLEPLDFSPMK